jgi:hypothetical protein
MKANVSEPLMKCRKSVDDIETTPCAGLWDESLAGACLLARWCPA